MLCIIIRIVPSFMSFFWFSPNVFYICFLSFFSVFLLLKLILSHLFQLCYKFLRYSKIAFSLKQTVYNNAIVVCSLLVLTIRHVHMVLTIYIQVNSKLFPVSISCCFPSFVQFLSLFISFSCYFSFILCCFTPPSMRFSFLDLTYSSFLIISQFISKMRYNDTLNTPVLSLQY